MNVFQGKTIILGVPKNFNMDVVIETELKAMGFKTLNISFHNFFRYKNNFQRIESFLAKNLLRKKHYKEKLNFKQSEGKIKSELKKTDKADYILIIRPDTYPIELLKELRKKGGIMVGYQWDGLDRYPNAYEYINLFDRFFVFDAKDLQVKGVLPTTNFYPTIINPEKCVNKEMTSDVFFTGSFHRERMEVLCEIVTKCKAAGLNVHCHLFAKRKYSSLNYCVPVSRHLFKYEENIRYALNTKILLDIQAAVHDGLSFRVLEAVGFEKKLITTNEKVKDYDFFNPDNILIWAGQSKEDIEAFASKPYVPVPEKIKYKYSFKNWIQYLLNEGDSIPLELANSEC